MSSILYFGTLVSMLIPESSLPYLKFFHRFYVLSEHPNISSNPSILFVHLEFFSFFSNYSSDNLYSLVAQTVKRLPAMWETWVQSLGWKDPLGKEMAIHSNTLAWKIPWTEYPGTLQSMGSQRVGQDWGTSLIFIPRTSLVAQSVKNLPTVQETWVLSLGQEDPLEKEMAPWSSILAWKTPWTEEPGRLQFLELQELNTT